MAGTREGGLKASAANKDRYGKDFYSRLGKKGGSAHHSKPRGFAAHPGLAKIAGSKGRRNAKNARDAKKRLVK